MKLARYLAIAITLATIRPCLSQGVRQPSSNEALSRVPITIDMKDVSFADALSEFARQTHLNVAADDVPLQNSATIRVNGTALDAIRSISEAFDYGWKQTSHGDILLVKQFSRPTEHPQFDKAEAVEIAAVIARLLRRLPLVPEQTGVTSTLRTLYGSLSPEQHARAANGSLRVKELSAEQQRLVSAAIIHNAFGDVLVHWEVLGSQLAGIQDSSIEFAPVSEITMRPSKNPLNSTRRLIYTWQRPGRLHRVTVPHFGGFEGQVYDGPLSPAVVEPPTELSDSARVALGKSVQLDVGETTVGKALVQLSSLSGLTIEAVEPLRRHKFVLCLGPVDTSRALDLICETTGLIRQPIGPERILFFRKRPIHVRQLTDIFAAIRSELPESWIAFLAVVSPRDISNNKSVPGDYKELKELGVYESQIGMPARNRQLKSLSHSFAVQLASALDARGANAKLKYSEMNDDQRQKLVSCLVLETLNLFCSGVAGAGGVVHKQVQPYQSDPGSAVVDTKGGGISINSLFQLDSGAHGSTGFGVSVPGAPR